MVSYRNGTLTDIRQGFVFRAVVDWAHLCMCSRHMSLLTVTDVAGGPGVRQGALPEGAGSSGMLFTIFCLSHVQGGYLLLFIVGLTVFAMLTLHPKP